MEYPEEVVAISKKGKREVRSLIDKGKFVRYEYLDPETGKKSENKIKLVLINDGKIKEEYFVIPLKQKNKFLLIKAENKPNRKLWDNEKKMVVDLL